MPRRPTPPPSATPRLRHRYPSPGPRRGRLLWAPLLLAGLLAAVALTGALGGGTLPGLSDASASSVPPRAETVEAPAVTGHTPAAPRSTSAVATVAVPATTSEPAPAAATTPGPTTSAEASSPSTSASAARRSSQPASSPAPTPTPRPEPTPTPEPAPQPAAAAAAAAGAEGQVLAVVNAERATAGCPALQADERLAAVARAHSADMRDRAFFSHTNPDGLDPFARARAAGISYARAENIAYGQPDAAAVMADWMSSSGHRQNILNCGLTTLGVGVAQGAGGPWWTQLFGG